MRYVVAPTYIPRPGTIVSVDRGLYRHYFITSDSWWWGFPKGISFEPDGVLERTWYELTLGQPWVDEGYPSDLDPEEVLDRAETFAKPYRSGGPNCEYHVRYAHGLPLESPQAEGWTALALIGAAVGLALVLRD